MYFFDFTVLLLQVVISTKEQVLYGILIVILSSIVLGYVSLAGQKKVQVMIISRHYQEIRDMLLQKLDLVPQCIILKPATCKKMRWQSVV